MRKKYFLSCLLSICTISLMWGQEAEKTFVQSFNLQGKKVIYADLNGDVQVQEWNNSVVRVQMNVKLDNATNSMLKGLATTGRYVIRPQLGLDGVTVSTPGLEKMVKYGGAKIEENVVYTIFVPSDVEVQMKGESSLKSTAKLD